MVLYIYYIKLLNTNNPEIKFTHTKFMRGRWHQRLFFDTSVWHMFSL